MMPNDVGEVMVLLWIVVEQFSPSDRTNCRSASDIFLSKVDAALSVDDGGESAKALMACVGSLGVLDVSKCGELLSMMRCIDSSFLLIHPRSMQVPGRFSNKVKMPDWLETSRISRAKSGIYSLFEGRTLVPRGPLLRTHREENAGYADSLGDCFCALAVTKEVYSFGGAPISIRQRVVWTDAARGVPCGARASTSKVIIVPVAENKGDLELVTRRGEINDFVDCKLSPEIDAAQRVIDVLQQAGLVDIAVAPEFTLREEHVNELSNRLTEEGGRCQFRLLVAGSGQTLEKNNQQPWNECVGINQLGAPLFKQRKLWPAAMDRARVSSLGGSVEGCGDKIFEDIASGSSVEIVDIESIGRCLVLICQDFKSALAQELIVDYQPDWVFVPILDVGIDVGRWMHQRAFELSEYSPARFIVACSASWAKQLNKETSLGMGVCSKSDENSQLDRRICLVPINPDTVGQKVIDWSVADTWKKTRLGVE